MNISTALPRVHTPLSPIVDKTVLTQYSTSAEDSSGLGLVARARATDTGHKGLMPGVTEQNRAVWAVCRRDHRPAVAEALSVSVQSQSNAILQRLLRLLRNTVWVRPMDVVPVCRGPMMM